MSYEEEISTLFARDLDNSRENERKIIADIHKLADENRALRRSLSLLQQNATLRTAKLITELVIWVDSMVETFQCSVTIPESSKSVGTHQEKSAFRPISPAIDGQNVKVTVPEIIVTSASQNLAQALSPEPEFFKPKIIIPESERLESPYDLSQRGTISKGDFYSQHSVISPTTNRLEVKQGLSRPRSPRIYKSKLSEQKKPTVDFSGNRTWTTQKTTPIIQSNFPEYQDVRLEESDSGSTGRDVAFYREPFEEDRSKYYQKYPQRTVQSNYPSSLDDTHGISQSTTRSGYDKVTQKTNQHNLNVPTTERRTVSEDPDLETNRQRETTTMVRRDEIVSSTTQSHPSSSSQQSYQQDSRHSKQCVSRNREGYDQRSRSPMPEQRIGQSYDQRNESSVLEERSGDGYDQRNRSPMPQQRYVKEPKQDVPKGRESHYQRTKSPMPDQTPKVIYDERSKSLMPEQRTGEGYDQRSKSPMPAQGSREIYNSRSKSPMPEQGSREIHDRRSESPIPEQSPKERYDQRSRRYMPEQRTKENFDERRKSLMPDQRAGEGYDQKRTNQIAEQRAREIYDERSKSPVPQQMYVSELEQNIPVNRESFDQNSKTPMPEQRASVSHDQRSRSLMTERRYATQPEQEVPKSMEMYDQRNRSPMPEQRAREGFDQGIRSPMPEQKNRYGFDQGSRSPMPEQRARERFDQGSRRPMPEQRTREGFDQESRSPMPVQRAKEGFDQGSRIPMPEQRAREGFDQESRITMQEKRAREKIDQGSRRPMPEQRTREGFDQESRRPMPEQRTKEGFDQGSRIPMPEQRAREGFDQGSRIPMPEQRAREGFDQGSRIQMQEQRAREGFDQGSKIPMPEQRAREGFDQGSRIPMPEQSAREGYDQGIRSPMPEQRVRERFDQESRSPMPEQRGRENYDQRRSLTSEQGSVKEATWNEQDVPRKSENREQRIYTPQQKYISETKTEQNIPKNQEKHDKRSRDSISEKMVAETNNLSKSPVQDRSRRSDAEIEEWESVDHMIFSGQQRKQVNDNSDAVVPQQDRSSDKSRSMYSKSYQRSTGEDCTGRNVVGDPIATSTPKTQRGVGEPIATSTPKTREEKLADSIMNKAKPLVSRPIDQLIGIDPTMTQERWLKAAMIRKNKRLIGEIAFQMDRRILEYVFAWDSGSKNAKKRRYYGFSIANIGAMIQKEAVQSDGSRDARKELEMRKRFENLVRTLAKLGYNLDQHGEFSQDMVNKYGLLSGPPSRKLVTELGLEDPVVLRVLFSQLIVDEKELNNVLVLLDCLCLLAYEDMRPLFMW